MKNWFAKQKLNLLIFLLLVNYNEGKINFVYVFIKANLAQQATHFHILG